MLDELFSALSARCILQVYSPFWMRQRHPQPLAKISSARKTCESGDRLNCWRSHVRPLSLALLYSFFGTFSQACRSTAPLCERDKLFVLELCTKVGCYGSQFPAVF